MSFDPGYTGTFGILTLIVLMLARVPIGIAMIAIGLGGFAFQTGWQPALSILVNDPASSLTSVDLATVPLFLLMGTFTRVAGFSADIFTVAAAFLGHRRGGLAYATISGSAVFGSVCGSSAATAATFAQIALPEMLHRKYDPGFAAGTIAAGGALKSLIPPSLIMILYCIAANTFILDMFVAAAIPAILVVGLNLSAIGVATSLRSELTPLSPRASWSESWSALRQAGPAFALMALVFGGLYSGVFTVNEAASVAAIVSLVFAVARNRLNFARFREALEQAAGVTVMIYVVIFGASIFSYFMSVAHVPDGLVQVIGQLPLPPLVVITLILIAYLLIGSVFDEIAAMLITLPFILPVIVNFGYDPLWWGVINVVIIELGLIIPPVGLIVFMLHGMAPQIGLKSIYRGVTPFIVADIVLLMLLTLFPPLVTWLPEIIGH